MKTAQPLIFLLIFLSGFPVQAEEYHVFSGFSINYADPLGTVRLGNSKWEIGKLRPDTYGFNQLYRSSGVWYMTFGVGVTVPFTMGFFMGGGFDWKNLLWKLGVRGELNSIVGINGYASGYGTLGLTLHF